MENVEKVCQFLDEAQTYYLATVEGDQPRVRPFGTALVYDGKLYIQTGHVKPVAKQIAANNHVCIVAYDGEEWIRINCELINESDNIEAKKAVIAEFDWAEEAGYTLDSPDFVLYRFANATAIIYNEDGEALVEEQF